MATGIEARELQTQWDRLCALCGQEQDSDIRFLARLVQTMMLDQEDRETYSMEQSERR